MAAADTAVLYMAAGEAESVKAALIAAGKPATTIALAENISLPGARCLSGCSETFRKSRDGSARAGAYPHRRRIRFCAASANNYDPDPEFRTRARARRRSTANQPSDHSAIEKPRVQSTTAHSPVPETRVFSVRESGKFSSMK